MSLTERLQYFHEAKSWHGSIPLQNRYTMGLAGEKFFREIKDNGRLLAGRCPQCGYTYLPPHIYCERCFAEVTEWVEVPPEGEVYAFTVLHIDLDEKLLPEPQILALVRFGGIDGGIVHRLGEVDPGEVCIGMPVEVVFKDKEKREGAITDIAYFRPL
jgi:uncharacterized OB-fold protein